MQTTQQASQLCTVCQSFWGNPAFNGLCSGCYKSNNKEEPAPQKQMLQEQKEEIKNEIVIDSTRCKHCSKKIGIYGYQCKCHYSFCAKHRVPEDHACTFDHAQVAKKQLIEQNPLVGPSKIDKI